MDDLIRIQEPTLLFNYGQAMEDPRDGLALFGPLDQGKPYGIRVGVVGTRECIRRFKKWVEKIQGPIANNPPRIARPPFPGFEAIFRIPWGIKPAIEIEVPDAELNREVHLDDKHLRVYRTVEVYSKRIEEAITQGDVAVDIWFIIITEDVHKNCRPQSYVGPALRIEAESKMNVRVAKRLYNAPSLFAEQNITAQPYHYEVDFHNQLKARLLKHKILTQIIRETTIAYRDFPDKFGAPKRNLEVMESAIAWNICTAAFYKAGGRPWKIGGIREGVCYIGIVFKRDDKSRDDRSACCAAQMFLDSGDGVVFKGDVGPWYAPAIGDFHLSRESAKELVEIAIKAYKDRMGNKPPRELFLHGRTRFNDDEWRGFMDAVDSSTNLVGVRIRDDKDLKLYRKKDTPVLRGLAYIRDERTAFLWTKGFVPRLQTYPGREVPNPMLIDVCKGNADINTVLQDILALTKLNYNACKFADGAPVTLKFADAVGEILTAAPLEEIPPLAFKHYI